MNTLTRKKLKEQHLFYFTGLLVLVTLFYAFPLYSQQSEVKKKEAKGQKAEIATLKPEDGTGAYATGKYRNLFTELGHSKKEISAKINKAYQLLFQGDSTKTIYFEAGKNQNGPLAYVKDVNNHDIRSEGMSYGMMIAVQMDKKAVFDALWNWAMTYMYVSDPAHPSEGYFSWSLKPDGTPNSETPAPDGEEYFVMALYFASGRWGDGAGIYDYKAWADKILTVMRHHPEKTGPTKFGPRTVHAMVNETHRMIRFVPDFRGEDFTDPSYHLPAFYELWARWGPEADRDFWAAAADSSRAFFLKAAHPVTGLSSDYAHFDGTPVRSQWNRNASRFAYDSFRTGSNWSVDWSWWRKNPQIQELSNRYQSFFVSQGMDKYGSNFELDGKVTNPGHGIGLVATNAVVSLAATHPVAREFTEALWNAPVPQSFGDRYYHGLLYLMSLLHCSGQYRIWTPR
jgi:oligosaccharide reducing-end xylanase